MATTHSDPTKRFSNRVENYVKFRPSYPSEVIDLLKRECGLGPGRNVADVGSGTGILTKLLLQTGANVFAVEPNREMRVAGEAHCAGMPGFRSIAASAEDTTLPDASMNIVIAGQAFHWFNAEQSRDEFSRILLPRGWVVLIWNDRHVDTTPFLRAYEEILAKYGTDYADVKHRGHKIQGHDAFFGSGQYKMATFPNEQMFDWESFLGRVLSSSYVPQEGHPSFESMLTELRAIYTKYQESDRVKFTYTTEVFYGQLEA
ncbi:MAG: methyltransferase [Armatimonadetes bacterium 55-13]|nr:class I SAM-dependent methyltransferase [Armatimonadota bacterium]OJU63307.1 MAG: methyltransferase [Armatimonadetes bacterium 55-13]